jgi:hypothetical protein
VATAVFDYQAKTRQEKTVATTLGTWQHVPGTRSEIPDVADARPIVHCGGGE